MHRTDYQRTPCCWAEQSLKVTERLLVSKLAVPQASWLNKTYFNSQIMQL